MADLKELIKEQIMNEVVKGVQTDSGWKVLIVDQQALRMISACCRMFDLTDNGITIVESIYRVRQPMLDQDAVYLMAPTPENVERVKKDFAPRRRYKCAHVFFIDAAPDDVLQGLAHTVLKPFVRTASELNMAFVPLESQVFTLDNPDGLHEYYSPHSVNTRAAEVAAQIASVCGALGECPLVRFSGDSSKCSALARLVQDRLDLLQKYDEDMQQSARKKRSQLLIVDRAFDVMSPLVHELTYQAAAYDLCNISEDIYEYKYEDGQGRTQKKQVVLGEKDDLWDEFRHSHVSEVFKGVSARFKEFQMENSGNDKGDGKFGTKELRNMMKNLPQHQEKMGKFSLHLDLSDKIMRAFSESIENCTKAEQNITMAEDEEGKKVKDFIGELSDVIVDKDVDITSKLRVLLLCIIASHGLDQKDLSRLLDLAEVPYAKRKVIQSLKLFDVPVEHDKKAKKNKQHKRRQRPTKFTLSRWAPVIKDVMEDSITGALDTRAYPAVRGTPSPLVESSSAGGDEPVVSARKRGGWAKKDKKEKTKSVDVTGGNGNRLIVFIVGTVSYNEMRAAYELSQQYNMDVVIGSHDVASPVRFLTKLEQLNEAKAAPGGVAPVGQALSEGDGQLTFVKGSTLPPGTQIAEI